MKKNSTLKALTECGIFGALAFVLDLAQGGMWRGVFANGGSIGLAMIPVLVVCFRRGPLWGILTGLLVGLLQMLGGVYAIAGSWWKVFFQVSLDYWMAYTVCGFAGFFKRLYDKSEAKGKVTWVVLGSVVAGLLKFLCHFLSGILYWPSDEWNIGSPAGYSFVYNGAYMFPNMIICAVILAIIALKQPKILTAQDVEAE